MPVRYPNWKSGETPRTDENAYPTKYRSVSGVLALRVENADYRNSKKFTGFFELVSGEKRKFSGKFGYEVYCSWFGVTPPSGYPKISVMDINYEIIESYTGLVIDDISNPDRKQPAVAPDSEREARLARLAAAPKHPAVRCVTINQFERNSDVVEEVLYRAQGFCEHCEDPAPFLRASDGTPFLEVHHTIPLAKGGEDTVENAVAVCPNCHRKAHYGTSI